MKSGRTIRSRFQAAIAEALEPRQLLSGTEYLVNSLDDTVAADNVVTLREAIQAANANAAVNEAPAGSATDADIIRFDASLFANGPATIRLNGTELSITGRLAITGPGKDLLTIDADGKSRVINTSSPDLTITKMSITGGNAGQGGGILNTGTCRFEDLLIAGNSASSGGGLYTSGGTLIDVTISHNGATNTTAQVSFRVSRVIA